MKNFRNALTTGDRKVVAILLSIIIASVITAMLTACTTDTEETDEAPVNIDIRVNSDTIATHKVITFSASGFSMSSEAMTRTALAESQLTDLWLFDYVDGELQQSLHQSKDDASFGTLAVDADYGDHTFYFVASAGDTPAIDGTTIIWNIPKDTFWKSLQMTVSPTTTNTAVSLSRVATRLKIAVNDEVPEGIASMVIVPAVWYFGLDYTTGEAISQQTKERTASVPESYIGSTDRLVMSIYGIAPADGFTTDIAVSARDTESASLGSVNIADVPMARNRVTSFSGLLFSSTRSMQVSIDDEWSEEFVGTW